jgi:hypothetical protein
MYAGVTWGTSRPDRLQDTPAMAPTLNAVTAAADASRFPIDLDVAE